jgi:mRNA-degrading endonuclease RelE of RelBE toxin-antitoxin system
MIEYVELPEFRKDFNRLRKRFRTLPGDFELAKKAAVELFHIRGINNLSTFEMPTYRGVVPVYKLKKFACRALKGRGVKSGLRVIYAWNEATNVVTFIEMYFKGDKANEDRARIKQYLKSLES